MKKLLSLIWWAENIHWLARNVSNEILYCWRWVVSCTPGLMSQYLRRKFWGIGHVGNKVTIEEGCWFSHPRHLILHDGVGINKNCIFKAGGGIEIGKNTLIGPNAIIWSQTHKYKLLDLPIAQQGYTYQRVVIEEDVWITARATILPGVKIGKGAVVGAGSVVNRDIAEFSVVVGVPAREISRRGGQCRASELS